MDAVSWVAADGTRLLDGVSLRAERGHITVLAGPSGSGKSTLMNLIGCLDTPTGGSYRLAGEDVSRWTDEQRSHLRNRRIGFVFQSFNLLPRTTALENVELPALYTGGPVDRSRARELLARVGLKDRADHYIGELSGGEQQRVALARALMNDPPLLLADEPTGNLDSASGDAVMELLTALNREGRTVVLVTHDERTAACARRELLIKDGLLASDRPLGSPADAAGHRPGLTTVAGP